MTSQQIEQLARALLGGSLPPAQPWEVGEAVTWIADAIARRDPAVQVAQVRASANALKRERQFQHTRLLAGAWHDLYGFDPTVDKLLAQALIDLSAFDAAERVLVDGLPKVSAPGAGAQAAKERLEFEGLLGRLAKQRFVETGDLDLLQQATDRYLKVYEDSGRPYWHGINAVALLAREEREGVPRAKPIDYRRMARDILAQVTGQWAANPDDCWLAATASEASLALGDCDAAEFWLYRLLLHPLAKAFEVNSYSRQLREVWQGHIVGTERTCADRLAGIVSRFQMREQSMWVGSPSDWQSALTAEGHEREDLEKNFSRAFGFSLDNVRMMLGCCSGIACITNEVGERLGTGFVVKGSTFKAAWGDGPVLVTNAHVISDTVDNAIKVAKARATFEVESAGATTPKFYPVKELLFTSAPASETNAGGVDVTVVRLDGLVENCCTLPATDALPSINARTRAYVIGHPKGSGLQVSLHDSVLLDIDDEERRVHYRTPTEPGSSGSPVFNSEWQVIAVHHSGSSQTPRLHGSGTYEANEGMSVKAVQQAAQ